MNDSVGFFRYIPMALERNNHPDNENGLFCQQYSFCVRVPISEQVETSQKSSDPSI
jgi:hypothetical protein